MFRKVDSKIITEAFGRFGERIERS